MPSFDTAKLMALASQLQQAAQSQDWPRLAQLDALLRQWLPHAQGEAVGMSEAAWLAVLQAHAQALAMCQAAKAEVAANLRNLDTAREAQHAYAWQEVLG